MVPVEEQPAPVSGVVVGVVTEQPGPSSGVVDQTLAMLDGLADEGGRGSLESLGRWNEKRSDRAMPIKLKVEGRSAGQETMVRVAFGKLVDELVQTNASSGILAISNWKEMRGPHEVTVSEVSWSASPDDVSYQRHGFVGMESDQRENIRFADFEGVVDDLGKSDQNIMAVYRVTLPRGGLDPDKWAGRPPPPAPEDLYTGPRRDGLLSTEEISGDYRRCCFPFCCEWMTVVPLGPDAIETWRTGCCFIPPFLGPTADGEVRTRNPGTNAFRNPQNPYPNNVMTFSADGTATQGCGNFKKRPGSQKRAFQKVDARDLAGNWCGCCCLPFVFSWPLSELSCTTKKALDEDRYAESGLRCGPWTLCLPIPVSATNTRKYVNGIPTNGFDAAPGYRRGGTHWHRDPGFVYGSAGSVFCAKKLC